MEWAVGQSHFCRLLHTSETNIVSIPGSVVGMNLITFMADPAPGMGHGTVDRVVGDFEVVDLV